MLAADSIAEVQGKVLTAGDMIPEKYRESGVSTYFDPDQGWTDIWECWANDEFVIDASRVTVAVGGSGWDGDTFKTKILMDKYGIQINKTSRNTVLFMTSIGTTRSSVAYLIGVLVKIARQLDRELEDLSPVERRIHERRVRSLTVDLPPLPDFSRFHPHFVDARGISDGDLRAAYFQAYDDARCEYLPLADGTIEAAMAEGRDIVSAAFVIPYPPGFPILVPGQIVSPEILAFMRALDVKEIHGYRPELGLRVFTDATLTASHTTPAGARGPAGPPGASGSKKEERA
jgi:arginine decarboxylase